LSAHFATGCRTPEKKKYLDEVTAKAQAERLGRDGSTGSHKADWKGRSVFRPYKCDTCSFWHLTTHRFGEKLR
jgi:hypothetical protein